MTINMQMAGVEKTIRALSEFPRRIANKHLRIALNAAGGIVKKEVIAQSPSKSLKKHIAVKVKIPSASFNVKHHDKPAYVVVGAKRGKTVTIKKKGIIRRAKGKDETRIQEKRFNISRILHLLERGTKSHQVLTKAKKVLATPINGVWTAFGTRVTVQSKGKYFMEKAASMSGPAAVQKAIQKLDQGIIQEATALSR